MLNCSVKPLIIAAATVGLIACTGSASHAAAVISFSPSTGSFGSVVGNFMNSEAIRRAQAECNNADCRIVIVMPKGCAYLAVGDNNGFGTGSSEQLVIRDCARNTSNCEIRTHACDRR
jgi:hypothetical protein